jgi:REase_MTES_1575/AAA domain
LTSGSPPEKIRAAVKRLNESFVAWAHLTQELQAILPMARLPGVGEPLEECAFSTLLHYAKDLQTSLNQFAALADPVLGAGPPGDMQAFVADLQQAEELLAFEASQATEAERWTKQLGPAFQGVGTDWDNLRKAITWTRRVRECLGAMQGGANEAFLTAATATPPSSRELRQALEQYEHALHSLELRFDAPGSQLEGKALREHPPETVLDLLTKWRDRVGELADWVDWRYLPERFGHLGLKSFWDHLLHHDVVREKVVDLFLKSFWSAWIDAMFQHDPVLSQHRRKEHEQLLQEFRALDRRILQQGAARITAILDPLQSKRGGDDPEIALLLKEAHKKTKHLPLRQLFDTMPSLLLQLKPCMLMSPLSVSQFLPADVSKMQFDLIVFDEASQILPEDAIGAIYRGKQLVVTGDNQQLPPTTFFQQNADDGAEEEETPLFESVLDACLGAGLPSKMLRWHYRSQHEHLIAFSNETYYDGRLVTFPSACFQNPALGVQFHHVPDGVYDRGGRRDNPREAHVIAQLVLEHFRQSPGKTLGVIAFSCAQMDAIEDEIEVQLREQPGLEPFFKGDRLEGFFVKNLETVQGDERDVILLSVGYGRDAQGQIALNFGPLNREGGERRLNVAVTRARQRLIVVSSIRAGDIHLGNSQAQGLADLQRYLDFAEHGMNALTPEADATPLPLTGLHEDVMRELKMLGFDSVPFVGCGPCRLDVGVCDPKQAGRFVLGIEFDGPMHAQAATARDRDRLRPEVLARLGWKLHRIGAPDWIFRKEEEIMRLREALFFSAGQLP